MDGASQPAHCYCRLTSAHCANRGARRPLTLAFGVRELDAVLLGGGLARGTIHEVSEGGPRPSYASNAVLFAAGIIARLDGPVLWCLHSRDLFASEVGDLRV